MNIKDIRRFSRAIDVLTRKLRKDPSNKKLIFGLRNCTTQLNALVNQK